MHLRGWDQIPCLCPIMLAQWKEDRVHFSLSVMETSQLMCAGGRDTCSTVRRFSTCQVSDVFKHLSLYVPRYSYSFASQPFLIFLSSSSSFSVFLEESTRNHFREHLHQTSEWILSLISCPRVILYSENHFSLLDMWNHCLFSVQQMSPEQLRLSDEAS